MPIPSKKIKALILVGGLGTRLHPLTFTIPKPLIPFVNKPMIEHQIEALSRAGVCEVILAMNYKYKSIVEAVKGYEEKYGIKITFSLENSSLGTAGPIALARKYLEHHTFFILNSDIICKFPFEDILNFHRTHGKMGTIVTTTVENPSKFGVILTKDDSDTIKNFIEKPTNFIGNTINAGIYVFEPELVNYCKNEEQSIEKEVFPILAAKNMLKKYVLEGFWMDIGTPKGYLEGQRMFLESFSNSVNNVIIGSNVSLGLNVYLDNCCIFDDVVIGDNVNISNSIIGRGSVIGSNSKISNFSVLGERTKISVDCEPKNDFVKSDNKENC